MRKKVKLGNIIDRLPDEVKDDIHAAAKDEGVKTDDAMVERYSHSEKARTNQLDPGSRIAEKRVSARTLDRDNEIVIPKGIDTKDFMKYGHVLVNHRYDLPPIGSDVKIWADDFGLNAQTQYADTGEGTMANVMWNLVQQGHMKASSIGFVILAATAPGHNDFEKVANKLERDWSEFGKKRDKVQRIITKSILLEHSDVSVPSNPDAEVIQVAKGFGATDDIIKTLGFEEVKTDGEGDNVAVDDNDHGNGDAGDTSAKGVIPFKSGPKAPKNSEWNGPREVSDADVKDLRKMCAWVDSAEPDLKGSYKLPYRRASGNHPIVWRGLRAAMASLFGARGGVDLPAGDRRGVYNVLAKGYAEFDEEPPEFRSYNTAELKSMFPEIYDSGPIVVRTVPQGIRVVQEPCIRVISVPDAKAIAAQALKDEIDRKRGVVR